MDRGPPGSTRTDTRFPYTPLFPSARSGGGNPERPEPRSARPLASQPGVEPFHRVGAAQMRGAGQRRLPKRREEKIGVADEPRLTLSDAAVRDAPAGKGAAGSRQRFEAAGAEQIGRAHV